MIWGARAVTIRFGSFTALQDVTFDAVPGQVRAVVGGDGAGKTTLLRALAGALMPEKGEVVRPAPDRIGYMSSGSGVYPDLTLQENLAFVSAAYHMRRAETEERAQGLLARTGLDSARDRLGGQLSGGMRQKLGVILAMLHRPDLLVLDEPTTGVDPLSRRDLWWLIARAAAEGAAVVLSTSYLDEAERAAGIVFLDRGRPLAAGTPDEMIAAMPGTVSSVPARPSGAPGSRAWRRGSQWRVWSPPDAAAEIGIKVTADLQDAVTVASLAHELGGSER